MLAWLRRYSFNDFVRHFERPYEPDTEEWNLREAIFNRRMEEVLDFHAGPPQSWTMGITKFMDFSDPEFNAMMGYRGRRKHATAALLSTDRKQENLPSEVNTLVPGSRLALLIRDQGGCGSCWAEAATAVLEARIESNKTLMGMLKTKTKSMSRKSLVPTLSTQTVVSCSPNPRHCGGSGGCGGATAELAYKLIKERGLPLAMSWPYRSFDGSTPACKDSVFEQALIGIGGWTVLPSNQLNPLKRALYDTGGPIAVTAAASGWAYYERGIYSDVSDKKPSGDFVVNHAVVLTGYKDPEPDEMGYWVVKNSWGESWGEHGYIRIEMKENEHQHCGWDYSPQEGIACDGDPAKAWVCGTCGILYDSTFPTGIFLRE